MFGDDYLRLRQNRLTGVEIWKPSEDGFNFLLFRSGSGKLNADSASHRVAHGDLVVLNSNGESSLSPAGSRELAFSHFSVRVEQMYPLFSLQEISLLHNVVGGFQSPKIYAASSPVAVACQQLIDNAPPHFNLEHRGHLLRIVAIVLGEEFKLQHSNRPGFETVEEHVVGVFERLSANDLLTLSATELAAKFGCGRRHLNRLFHHFFGFSVASLRMELRMLRAVSLLQNPTAKVINIAEQCGFNHLGLFNMCFNRRFGCSPGKWRKAFTGNSRAGSDGPSGSSECPFQTNGLCPKIGGPLMLNGTATAGSGVRTPESAMIPFRLAAANGTAARPPAANGQSTLRAS